MTLEQRIKIALESLEQILNDGQPGAGRYGFFISAWPREKENEEDGIFSTNVSPDEMRHYLAEVVKFTDRPSDEFIPYAGVTKS